MDKPVFFTPDILENSYLPEDEAGHCLRVLRKNEGDEIFLTDGKGYYYEAVIREAGKKKCAVEILTTIEQTKPWDFQLHIAFAPTKNIDRIEWLAEKMTEIGVDKITPLQCRFSERKEIKLPRIEKILVSAMKQSQKAYLPELSEMLPFKEFVKQPFDGRKFIAHCYEGEKKLIKDLYQKGEDVLILIGPEGDFSPEEVELALQNGFEPISLGKSRLRTETAALVACHTMHVLNQ